MASFRPIISSRSGPKQPTVFIKRIKMLPAWDIDFHNGYTYLLVYYGGKWGALAGDGYSTPTAGNVRKMASAILTYQLSHAGAYQRLVAEVDGAGRWDVPHPICRDYNNPPRPEVHAEVIVGSGNDW